MMTSFLVKERTKETYLQKISSEPQGTQQNRIVTINNFERFVSELYEEKTIESVIEELKILKKTEEEMLGYGIGIILLNVGMYFVAPAVLIISLRKHFHSVEK